MKKFLIAGSSLAAVAAAGSAGAVDVTLGGSIDMGVKYGVGKDTTSGFGIGDNYQSISISVGAAGTTDAGLKFGGSFSISTADELAFNPYGAAGANVKLVTPALTYPARCRLQRFRWRTCKAGSMVSVKINSEWHAAGSTITGYAVSIASINTTSAVCKLAGEVSAIAAGNVTRGTASLLLKQLALLKLVWLTPLCYHDHGHHRWCG